MGDDYEWKELFQFTAASTEDLMSFKMFGRDLKFGFSEINDISISERK